MLNVALEDKNTDRENVLKGKISIFDPNWPKEPKNIQTVEGSLLFINVAQISQTPIAAITLNPEVLDETRAGNIAIGSKKYNHDLKQKTGQNENV